MELVADRSVSAEYFANPHLFTVKITMEQRGTPANCARIYRLPSNDPDLRSKWLSLRTKSKPSTASKNAGGKHPQRGSLPRHARNQVLAKSLLQPVAIHDGLPKAGEEDYPIVPDEKDLIGYVTTGNYNLAEGMPTAIGNVALHRVAKDGKIGLGGDARVCIIREAGRTIGRLATWEVV